MSNFLSAGSEFFESQVIFKYPPKERYELKETIKKDFIRWVGEEFLKKALAHGEPILLEFKMLEHQTLDQSLGSLGKRFVITIEQHPLTVQNIKPE